MPQFRTTAEIFRTPKPNEKPMQLYTESEWTNDTPELLLPEKKNWDYSHELQVEEVDLWEVIFEYASSGKGGKNFEGGESGLGLQGLYAAWNPYAEFYLLLDNGKMETFYGKTALKRLRKCLDEREIPYFNNPYFWVDDEDMWLYTPGMPKPY